jgi:hypothetical protein
LLRQLTNEDKKKRKMGKYENGKLHKTDEISYIKY